MVINPKETLVRELIRLSGDNPDRKGLLDTPARVVKMWDEVYEGYDPLKAPKLTTFDNNEDGMHYDEMVGDTGQFYSTCEHHLVPFFGEYYFAYIPDKKILGLSKVARLIKYHSRKFQVQERLVADVLDQLEKVLQPKGIALVLKGRHLCKEMRGVQMHGGMMTTSDLRGVFKTKPEVRMEFLQLIK